MRRVFRDQSTQTPKYGPMAMILTVVMKRFPQMLLAEAAPTRYREGLRAGSTSAASSPGERGEF